MYSNQFDSAYKQLMEYMENMKIVDTHEHLPAEEERAARNPDFSLLFSHYCSNDLQTAGMPQSSLNAFVADGGDVKEKWEMFEPYYHLIHDGSYAHAARIGMKRFYGMDDIASLDDAVKLTELIRAENTPGIYQRMIADACNIRVSLNFGGPASKDGLICHIPHIDRYAEVSLGLIRELEDKFNISCSSLSKYEDAVRMSLESFVKDGAKGLKFTFAYMRDLEFKSAAQSDAERIYNRFADEGHGRRDAVLGYEERRPLMDYMVHRICEMAAEFDIPVVFHSAMQAEIMHKVENARPMRLWNLPHRHRKTSFVLLHSGFPWMEDGAMLAKHYPNLYLDMAWTHVMSPDITARVLGAWIDLIPVHKIMGFGGDYHVVEKIYGHLTLARRSIAIAMANKVCVGDLTMQRAVVWLNAILHDNASRIYKV